MIRIPTLSIIFTVHCYFFLLSTLCYAREDTVFGCGGFIRWTGDPVKGPGGSKLDYAQLKINLYVEKTKTLKEVSEVLPNGAYSVPLYDKAVYRLKLSTPKGWSVSPLEGHIVDLIADADACTHDFDFSVIGFTVSGQVLTSGMDTGPAGLLVQLKFMEKQTSSTKSTPVLETQTVAKGRFTISDVMPGQYQLLVFDSKLSTSVDTKSAADAHVRAHVTVMVGWDSVHLKEPVILLGNYVRGRIVGFDGRSAWSNALIYLLHDSAPDTLLPNPDCRSTFSIEQETQLLSELKIDPSRILCKTEVDQTGQFSFDRLPGGSYLMVPVHTITDDKGQHSVRISFNPDRLRLEMEHTDVDLGITTFQAVRFTLAPGQLLWPDNQPIGSANLSVTGLLNLIPTDADGFYEFGPIEPGQYTIKVQSDHGAQFESTTLDLHPNLYTLPTLRPNKLLLCGRLEPVQDLPSLLVGKPAAKVTIQSDSKASSSSIQVPAEMVEDHFRFCQYLQPGQYTVKPDVKLTSPSERFVHFAPLSLLVPLLNKPVINLVFTQFRANLSGRVVCLHSCPVSGPGSHVRIRLQSVNTANAAEITERSGSVVMYASLKPTPNNPGVVTFDFLNVLPDDYFIDVIQADVGGSNDVILANGWCWSSRENQLNATTGFIQRVLHVRHANLDWTNEPYLNFIQTGYTVIVQSILPSLNVDQLSIQLEAKFQKKTGNETQTGLLYWLAQHRLSKLCLPSEEIEYTFAVSSPCLKLAEPSLRSILVKRDCLRTGSNLHRCPPLILTVSKLPLTVTMRYASLDLLIETDKHRRDQFTAQSIPIKVTRLATRSANDNTVGSLSKSTEIIRANWSATDTGFPVARVVIWLDPNQRIQLHPQMTPLNSLNFVDGWSYTYLVEPTQLEYGLAIATSHPSDVANLDLESLIFLPALLKPVESFKRGCIASKKQTFDSSDSVEFKLLPATVFRGSISPPVDQVNVKLLPTDLSRVTASSTDAEDSIDLAPLLPIHKSTVDPIRDAVQATSDQLSLSQPQEAKEDEPTLVAVTQSDAKGRFIFGPLRLTNFQFPFGNAQEWFLVQLNKPGFEFASIDLQNERKEKGVTGGDCWRFRATKLSFIEVSVNSLEASGKLNALPGVLVSIIGEGYRGNQFTDSQGLVHFVGLAPGQYYLRPMMKEYQFSSLAARSSSTQSSTQKSGSQAFPIDVVEGISVKAEILAERTAFSISGLVQSISKVPEPNVLIESEWVPELPAGQHELNFGPISPTPCPLSRSGNDDMSSVPPEQSLSDSAGLFRLRGFLPGCLYSITVSTSTDLMSEHADRQGSPPSETVSSNAADQSRKMNVATIERSIPSVAYVRMSPTDVDGLMFYVFRPLYMSTLTATVDTSDEYRETLLLTVFPLNRPDQIIARHDFATDSYLFILSGPKFGALYGRDHVVRLESILNPSFFTNIDPQEVVIKPQSNRSETLNFQFKPIWISAVHDQQTTPRPEL